jgi:hypothetical protein
VLEKKLERHSQEQQYQRMPVDPVERTPRRRQFQIVVHRQQVQVTQLIPVVELGRVRVMQGVGATPVAVRRKRGDTEQRSQEIVGHARTKEGAVPAVVLNDEGTNHERPGNGGEHQRERVLTFQAAPPQVPGERERYERRRELAEAGKPPRPCEADHFSEQDLVVHE